MELEESSLFISLFEEVTVFKVSKEIEPHNPRTTPTKTMMNIASHSKCNPGGGIYFAALLGSDNLYTTPSKNLL